METILKDVGYAVRGLIRQPAFTAVAVLSLAFGIGVNTAIFSLANAILLRPLGGVHEPARLIEVGRSQDGEGSDTFGYPTIDSLRRTSRTADVAGWTMAQLAIGGDEPADAVLGAQVTGNYFTVLGTSMQLGRTFAAGEAGIGSGESVLVISDALWELRFERDPEVVGREVLVNGVPSTVIGVTVPQFRGTMSFILLDAWVPFGMQGSGLATDPSLEAWQNNFVSGLGRLRPGETLETARSELTALVAALVEGHPEAMAGQGAVLGPLGTVPAGLRGGIQLFMLALLVVVGLGLVVTCVNVAGMLVARSLSRSREVALRQAIGASRGRLVRQLLTESTVLFVLGGGLGIAIAVWASRLLRAFNPPLPPPFEIVVTPSLDARVLAFALATTLVTSILFGVGPALRGSRADLVTGLKEDASTATGGRSRLRGAMVVAQVAVTVVLLVASGLFLRALGEAGSVGLGFDPDDVYGLAFNLNLGGYEAEHGQRVMRELRAEVQRLPSVDGASFSALLPIGLPSRMGFGGIRVAGVEPPDGGTSWDASVNVVSPGYFDTLRMPLVEGGDFRDGDGPGAAQAAVINQRAATHFWPDGDAVGQQFDLGGTLYTVRGVAADAKYSTLTEETPFFVYVSVAQRYRPQMNLLVRTRAATSDVLREVRTIAHRIAPELPVLDIVSLRGYVEVGFLPQRVAANVAGVLGLVAAVLAAMGIYGVTAHAAARRGREIGVRVALGAGRREVVQMMVRQGLRAPLLGLVTGLALAALASRLLGSLLFGVSPLDPIAYAVGIAVLLAAAFIAAYLPARGAARVDPVAALRSE